MPILGRQSFWLTNDEEVGRAAAWVLLGQVMVKLYSALAVRWEECSIFHGDHPVYSDASNFGCGNGPFQQNIVICIEFRVYFDAFILVCLCIELASKSVVPAGYCQQSL